MTAESEAVVAADDHRIDRPAFKREAPVMLVSQCRASQDTYPLLPQGRQTKSLEKHKQYRRNRQT